jgi:hypothetical protein
MRRFAILSILVGAALGGSAIAGDRASFELFPGAVVDRGHESILVMQPQSAISVLDTATGRERCTTKHAARPLLIRGERVLGQTESGGNVLRLHVFEFDRGAPPSECALAPRQRVEVELPTDVHTRIDDRIDSAFVVRAWPDASATGALVEWSYRTSPAFPDSHARTGMFRVDLATGAVTAASATVPRPLPRALPPGPTSAPREVALGGDVVAIAVASRADGSSSVELSRRSAGRTAETTTLADRDLRAVWLSSDDRTLLLSSLEPTADPGERYVWALHSLDTWRRLGEVRAGRSGAEFFVRDGVVVHREDRGAGRDAGTWIDRPLRLVAQTLADGREVWSHPVRDTGYRGVRAPAQPGPRRGRVQGGSR